MQRVTTFSIGTLKATDEEEETLLKIVRIIDLWTGFKHVAFAERTQFYSETNTVDEYRRKKVRFLVRQRQLQDYQMSSCKIITYSKTDPTNIRFIFKRVQTYNGCVSGDPLSTLSSLGFQYDPNASYEKRGEIWQGHLFFDNPNQKRESHFLQIELAKTYSLMDQTASEWTLKVTCDSPAIILQAASMLNEHIYWTTKY